MTTPDDRHERRAASDGHHLPRRRFEADVEEQQDGAELGQDRERLAGGQGGQVGSAEECRVPRSDPHEQLTKHRRLTQAQE